MIKYIAASLMRRFMILFVFGAVVPVAAVALLAYFSTSGQTGSQAGTDDAAYLVLTVGLALAGAVCLAGYLTARSVSNPLKLLAERVSHMAEGDLRVQIPATERSDEVGVVAQAVNELHRTLHEQNVQLKDSAGRLSSAISEISSTAAQLAVSATETSSSIREITTTVEEVKQTAYISNDKATCVEQSAGKVAEVSAHGTRATEEAAVGINRIKGEMEYVAESIVKLSEQTQSIGEIINAVNDLADQSNLLSVNASIEAAKAGDYGKGFAVVAQEVKNLADQSKNATEQVRGILSDIQKATSAAVLSTERGSKAVEAGVSLSEQAGSAIGVLSGSINESEQAASQIAASAKEQLVGIDQLAMAMQSISEATQQNVNGAKHLETATADLNNLTSELKGMSLRFHE